MNTKIFFLYRDASNYKVPNRVVLEGELSETEIEDILNARYDGEWFSPFVIDLECERFGDETEDDHIWFELYDDSFSPTTEKPTSWMTASEFYEAYMEASKDNWAKAVQYAFNYF